MKPILIPALSLAVLGAAYMTFQSSQPDTVTIDCSKSSKDTWVTTDGQVATVTGIDAPCPSLYEG